MKFRLKTFLLTICLSISLFCFAGCNPFGGSGLDFDDGGSTYIKHNDDEVRPSRPPEDHSHQHQDATIPNDEDWLFKEGAFDEAKAQFYGVRTLYTPNAQSESYLSSDVAQSVLADRQKFDTNAVKQYEYMAKYILINLVDHYGVQLESSSENYNFYADNSLVPTGSPTKYSITYDPSVYRGGGGTARDIQTSGWPCRLNLDGLSGSELDAYYENSYAGTYLNAFVPYLQIRLIETAFGVPTDNQTNIASMVNLSANQPTTQAQARINAYAHSISKLGIQTEINGAAINYGQVVRKVVIGDESLLLSPYASFVGDVVDGFLDDVAPNFPQYTRTEFCDIVADVYFDGGTRGTPTKLSNMEYQEYYSVSYFTKEDAEHMADVALDIFIDSKEDIVLDVYVMYIKANVGYKIDYAGTLHTDSSTHYYYAPEDPDDNVDYNAVTTNNNQVIMYYDLSTEDRDADPVYSAYLDPSKDSFGIFGTQNPLYSQTEQVYGGVIERTGKNNMWNLPSDKAHKNGEVVDLSDIMVYAPLDVDGVVVIFDIQYPGGGNAFNHAAGDYSFRYLIHIEGANSEDMKDVNLFSED